MKHLAAFTAPALLALSLAACSGSEPTSTASSSIASDAVTEAAPSDIAPEPVTSPAPTEAGSKTIGLEGLGDLRLGQAVPSGSSWASRGAQASDACQTVTSPDYPGVYAIVERGKVQRITVGQRSDVKLVEGVRVGSTEADVKKWFAGFREEPHKYVEAPAKYLTAPNAESGGPAVRFEIGKDGKVSMIHVGMMPVLGYVEGCG